MKRLDHKLANILDGSTSSADFIIADAKDADMAFGISAPGPQPGPCPHGCNESEGCWKTLPRPYNGPGPLEELVSYDPHMVVGILGGSAGTTLDAFQLIHGVLQQTGIQPHPDLEQDLQSTIDTTTHSPEPAISKSVGSRS